MKGDYRTGIGFDAHRFDNTRKLVLGGIEIPDSPGLAGHSDADVLLHAICDALLGACALGDLGMHFPDTSAKWKGISSADLLAKCTEMAIEAGFSPEFVDVTVITEHPKLAPYNARIREKIASAMKLGGIDFVSVKATTTEGLGFAGRKEGIAAIAAVTVVRAPAGGEVSEMPKSKSRASAEGKEKLPGTVYKHPPSAAISGIRELSAALKELDSILCYTDGASLGNPGPSGCAAVICEPGGEPVCAFSWKIGNATNNVAEYSALIELLKFFDGSSFFESRIEIKMDSELVVKQVNGIYKVKSPSVSGLFAEASALAARFKKLKITHVPRGENSIADYLAKEASKLRKP